MRFPEETIERVREASDIVAVISEHVQLKRTGRTFKARCPFHQEKTPSFHVNPARNIFKCFGCGEGGDVFHFLMTFDKLSFPEAVEVLAGRAGVPLPQMRGAGSGDDESVYPALEGAAAHYHRALAGPTGSAAREYLNKRGLGDDVIERFALGWAAPGWSHLLDAAGSRFSPALLLRAGLIAENDRGGHYDRFRNRLIIPIRSALGRTIGFGARTLTGEEPKYLNSPETEVFNKRRVLYGLSETRDALKESSEVLVVEGYMDALALVQGGIGNVVASCGTAFTEEQARVIRRYVDRAVLLFDGDRAGLRAAWKSAGIFLGAGLEVRIVTFPPEHDPDSYLQSEGSDALRDLCQRAPGVVGFAKATLLDMLEKREDLIKAFAVLGSRIDDPIRRRLLLQEAAEAFRFHEETLARETARLRGETRAPLKPAPASPEAVDRLGRVYLAGVIAGQVGEDDLLPIDTVKEPGVRDLYRRWLELRKEDNANPQHQMLADEERRGLTAEILSEDTEETDFSQVVARIRQRHREVIGKGLRDAIRDAEARDDQDEVGRLLRELHSLKEPSS